MSFFTVCPDNTTMIREIIFRQTIPWIAILIILTNRIDNHVCFPVYFLSLWTLRKKSALKIHLFALLPVESPRLCFWKPPCLAPTVPNIIGYAGPPLFSGVIEPLFITKLGCWSQRTGCACEFKLLYTGQLLRTINWDFTIIH